MKTFGSMRRRKSWGWTAGAVLAGAVLLIAGRAGALSDDIWQAPQIWDLKPGTHAADLPEAEFAEYACGTNGGPPSTPLSGWTDYQRCAAEPGTGLHEVYFRYDDQAEYEARARHNEARAKLFAGTTLYDVAVIASALFDDDGFLHVVRAVTDPRVPPVEREHAIALRNFLIARYGADGWSCTDLPPESGETKLGDAFLKQDCRRTVDDTRLTLASRYLRREGQYGIDPNSGQRVPGLFVSEVRFEIQLVGEPADRQARLAAIAARAGAVADAEADWQRALDCPGCDLTGIELKRRNLAGANLAGANLSGANLHAANLDGANLAGANLSGANLNRASLRKADLSGVRADDAMFFAARLDGANLAHAVLSNAHMSEAQLTSANLSGITAVGLDLIRARLPNANLTGADIEHAYLSEAQLGRADFTGASLITVDMSLTKLSAARLSRARIWGTDLYGADLRDADLTDADFNGCRLTAALMANARTEGTKFADTLR